MKAYNDSVQSVPEAFNKPSILKNLMVRNLQSSGIKDPFEMKQEMEISKQLRERDAAAERKVLDEKLRIEAQKDKEKPQAKAVPKIEATSALGALTTGAGEVGKAVSERQKETRKKTPTLDEKVERDLKMLQKNIIGSPVMVTTAREALRAHHQGRADAQQQSTLNQIGFAP